MNRKISGKLSLYAVFILSALAGCGIGKESVVEESDYRIIPIIRSVAEEIKVGAPLDTADYNYTGVLNDEEGKPLYTNRQGEPGTWRIQVVDSTTVKINNMETGNLRIEDLRKRVLAALGRQKAYEYVGHDFKHKRQTIHTIPNGYMTMTVTSDTTGARPAPTGISIILKQ